MLSLLSSSFLSKRLRVDWRAGPEPADPHLQRDSGIEDADVDAVIATKRITGELSASEQRARR